MAIAKLLTRARCVVNICMVRYVCGTGIRLPQWRVRISKFCTRTRTGERIWPPSSTESILKSTMLSPCLPIYICPSVSMSTYIYMFLDRNVSMSTYIYMFLDVLRTWPPSSTESILKSTMLSLCLPIYICPSVSMSTYIYMTTFLHGKHSQTCYVYWVWKVRAWRRIHVIWGGGYLHVCYV